MLTRQDADYSTRFDVMNRREIIKRGLYGAGAFCANMIVSGSHAGQDRLELLAPDKNGVRLPAGFSSRIVAESSVSPIGGCEYVWHAAPDGGACFSDGAGGWIYVSNSELDNHEGGVGALRFDTNGKLIDAYPVLHGTSRNCSGVPRRGAAGFPVKRLIAAGCGSATRGA